MGATRMGYELADIDPQWAWSPFESTERRPWNLRLAAHLLRRGGFGGSWDDLTAAAAKSPADAVNDLFLPHEQTERWQRQIAPLDHAAATAGNVAQLPAWWFYRLAHSPDPLLEKLTLLWHGHFATSGAKVQDARLMWNQHQLLRNHARGSFRDLVHAMAKDPAMLTYLDAGVNRKTHPNENFARELMELFCLGTGPYTERDIQELARALTGWELQHKRFRFNAFEHDAGVKEILGTRGTFSGEEGVELVLNHEATARFVAGKLFGFFVSDEPAPPAALLEPLAEALRESDFEIARVVRRILGSQLFFSRHAIGRKVRSPVELSAAMVRALEVETNLAELSERSGDLGQRIFYPPSVKGWDGGRTWINSATLLGRVNLVRELVQQADAAALAERAEASTASEIVRWAEDLLLAEPLGAEVRQRVEANVSRESSPARRAAAALEVMGALPEFQLG